MMCGSFWRGIRAEAHTQERPVSHRSRSFLHTSILQSHMDTVVFLSRPLSLVPIVYMTFCTIHVCSPLEEHERED